MKKFVRRYLSVNVLPIWMILAMDVVMIGLSLLLAYALRYDFSSRVLDSATMWRTMGLTMVVSLVFFKMFRTYSSVLRLSSFVDIARIFVALFVSYTAVALACMVAPLVTDIRLAPVNVILMAFIINFALMASSRVIVKMMFETIKAGGSSQTNIFIYGAKEAGVNIAKSLRVSMRERYRLRGFIADEPDLYDKLIMGVRVFPNDENLFDILAQKGVKTIIVSPAKRNELKKEENLDRFLKHNIKLLTAPPLSEWNQRGLESGDIKEIQIEDLLQRDPIQIDIRKVASHLEGKRVMITGAAGSIGSEIMRQVATFNPYKLILVDQAETPLHDIRLELMDKWRNLDAETIVADIANQTRMEAIFEEFRPQYIFHAAAYKHVPMMEDNVSESIQTNVAGTRILADLAVKYKAEKFVMISTDKAVNPTNVMGCSKRICEIYVQSLAKKLQKEGGHVTQFITTRFGNVLGSNGSVIPRFKDQIRRGGPVTVTHPDIIRYFMTIPEACRLVLEAAFLGKGSDIFIFDMGKPVRIADMARQMIRLSGLQPDEDIQIKYTGLRPGEKLYEELLYQKENTTSTDNPKIFRAKSISIDFEEIRQSIDRLIEMACTDNKQETVRMMKAIAPDYVSQHSIYEKLDKN